MLASLTHNASFIAGGSERFGKVPPRYLLYTDTRTSAEKGNHIKISKYLARCLRFFNKVMRATLAVQQ
jgi:hypothetical protein